MQQHDLEPFRDLIEGVSSFYGRDVSPFALDVWWTALRHYDLAAIRDAFGRHSVNPDSGQFMPKPADIVRMIEGSTLDAAVLAWTKIDRAIQVVGTYATVAFDDPLIHRVIDDMGSWIALGQKSVDEWPFVGKEFQTRYRGYKARREAPAYPPSLIGITDATNAKQGFQTGRPALIGDPKKAAEVYRRGCGAPRLTVTTHVEQLLLGDDKAA